MKQAFFVLLVLFACTKPAPTFPRLELIEAKVKSDLDEHKTDAQIRQDVCTLLGGKMVADEACARAEDLVQDVLSSFIDADTLSIAESEAAAAWLDRHAADLEARATREENEQEP